MKVVYSYFGLMQRIGGVSRYFYEVISRIRKDISVSICSVFISNEYFKSVLHRIWFSPKNRYGVHLRVLIEEFIQCLFFLFGHYDVIHLTAERKTPFLWTRKPIVITIHDMIPELFRTDKKVIERRRIAINKSAAIICVSENTKSDLLRIFPNIPEEKVTVTYHGYYPHKADYGKVLEGEYILYVGSRTAAYKNFKTMLRAICPLLKEREMNLVCTGDSFNSEELKLINELSVENEVVNVGFVTDETLASLYHFASCFLYPSLYEGFGIPILEAWDNQCPVCLSYSSCFPEIAGEAAVYFNPLSTDQIYNAVMRILSDEQLRSTLIDKGQERLKLFSWDKAASKTLEVYKSIIERV